MNGMDKLNALIGQTKVKKQVMDIIAVEQSPLNIKRIGLDAIVIGNHGSGKSTFINILGEVYRDVGLLERGHVVEVSRNDLISGYVGQTTVKTRDKIKEAMGGILCINELYDLYKDSEKNSFAGEAFDEIMRAMLEDKGKFAIIATGFPEEMQRFHLAHKDICDRFETVFKLDDYSAKDLYQIFNCKISEIPLKPDADLTDKLPLFFYKFLITNGNDSQKKIWNNAREIEKLVEELGRKHAISHGKIVEEDGKKVGIFTEEHFPEHLQALFGEIKECQNKFC